MFRVFRGLKTAFIRGPFVSIRGSKNWPLFRVFRVFRGLKTAFIRGPFVSIRGLKTAFIRGPETGQRRVSAFWAIPGRRPSFHLAWRRFG